MKQAINVLLGSLALAISTSVNAAEPYKNWAGPYVGIFAGSSSGEDKALGTGAGTSSNNPNGGVCINTSSENPVSDQTNEGDCGNKGVGNPFVWLPNLIDNGGSQFANNATQSSNSRSLKGFKIGYNWQKDRLVYGVEADYRNIDEETLSSSSSAGSGSGAIGVNAEARLGLDSMLSARGRLGYLVDDRFMPYVTAGLASGRVSTSSTATYTGTIDTDPKSFGGTSRSTKFIYGVGADFKITNNLLLGVNLLWVDFGTQNASSSSTGLLGDTVLGAGAGASVSTDSSVRMFSAGLSWLFN